jgi:hypothetical protein
LLWLYGTAGEMNAYQAMVAAEGAVAPPSVDLNPCGWDYLPTEWQGRLDYSK